MASAEKNNDQNNPRMAPITKMMLALALELIALGAVALIVNTAIQLIVIGVPLLMVIHFAVEVLIPTKMPD